MKPNIKKIIQAFAAKRHFKLDKYEEVYFIFFLKKMRGEEEINMEQNRNFDKINHMIDMSLLNNKEFERLFLKYLPLVLSQIKRVG